MNNDGIVIAATIGAAATVSAAVISTIATRRSLTKPPPGAKPIANISHAQRDYSKTQDTLQRLLAKAASLNQKPDLYLTNFGTPVSVLRGCRGYEDYHRYLVELSDTGRCVLHRYFALTKEPELENHITDLLVKTTGHTDENVLVCDSAPFGAIGDVIVNFLGLTDIFGAVTFETPSKILLSLHTCDPVEVAAIVEVVRSIEPHCKRLLTHGARSLAVPQGE